MQLISFALTTPQIRNRRKTKVDSVAIRSYNKAARRGATNSPAAPHHSPALQEQGVMAICQSIDSLPALPTVDGVEIRHIPGCFGYAAGNDGTIWTCRKRSGLMLPGDNFDTAWRIKKPTISRYCHVALFGSFGNKTMGVHRAVLLAFVGECPDGMQCLHGDGNRHNNRLQNLRWGTPKENCEDRQRHGTQAKGETQHLAKLSDDSVAEVRRLFATGRFSKAELGRRFGVSPNAIRLVVTGQTWRHVP